MFPERLELARRLSAQPMTCRRVPRPKLRFAQPEHCHRLAEPVATALGRLQRVAPRGCCVSRPSRAHLDQRPPRQRQRDERRPLAARATTSMVSASSAALITSPSAILHSARKSRRPMRSALRVASARPADAIAMASSCLPCAASAAASAAGTSTTAAFARCRDVCGVFRFVAGIRKRAGTRAVAKSSRRMPMR